MMTYGYTHSCNLMYMKATLLIFTSWYHFTDTNSLNNRAIASHNEAPRIFCGHNLQSTIPTDSFFNYEIFVKWRTIAVSSSGNFVLSRSYVPGIATPGSSGWCLPDQILYTEVWHHSYCCQFVVAVCYWADTYITKQCCLYTKQFAEESNYYTWSNYSNCWTGVVWS